MITQRRHMWGTLAVLAVLAPSAAAAQTVANSFEELRKILKNGQTIVVTNTIGQQTLGKVGEVSPSFLVVFTPDARTFAAGTVTEIRRPDAVWNGALTGLGVGVGVGLVIVNAMCSDGPDCGPAPQVLAATAGIGAAIGAGIDASLSNRGRVIYRLRQKTLTLTISPLVGKDRKAVLAVIRF